MNLINVLIDKLASRIYGVDIFEQNKMVTIATVVFYTTNLNTITKKVSRRQHFVRLMMNAKNERKIEIEYNYQTKTSKTENDVLNVLKSYIQWHTIVVAWLEGMLSPLDLHRFPKEQVFFAGDKDTFDTMLLDKKVANNVSV